MDIEVPKVGKFNSSTAVIVMLVVTVLGYLSRASSPESFEVLGGANYLFEVVNTFFLAYLCLSTFRTSAERRMLIVIAFALSFVLCAGSLYYLGELAFYPVLSLVLNGAILTNQRGFERLMTLIYLRIYVTSEMSSVRDSLENLFKRDYAILIENPNQMKHVELCLLSAGAYRTVDSRQIREFINPHSVDFPLLLKVAANGSYQPIKLSPTESSEVFHAD